MAEAFPERRCWIGEYAFIRPFRDIPFRPPNPVRTLLYGDALGGCLSRRALLARRTGRGPALWVFVNGR